MAHVESHRPSVSSAIAATAATAATAHGGHEPGEEDIVALWLRKDPVRWAAGVAAGIVAGMMSLVFAMVLAKANGLEAFYPARIPALPILGNSAMEFANGTAIFVGVAAHLVLCSILGFVYAHFTATNVMTRLLGAGLTWALFSWIFITNLFAMSFTDVAALSYSRGAGLFVNLVFGLSLTSVAFFDKAFRGAK
jgi:hypothetical protein